MPPLTSAGASARPAARTRASASAKPFAPHKKSPSPKSAPREKPAPARPKPCANSARGTPAPRKKPASRRRRTKVHAVPKLSPHATRRVTPFGMITVRSGRPLHCTPALKAHARHRYEHTPESTYSIATDLGMHHTSLNRLAKREGWVRHHPPQPRDITTVMRLADEVEALAKGAPHPNPLPASGERELTEFAAAAAANAADTDAIDRLEAAVLKELTEVERTRASLGPEPLRPFDAQVTARTLASLTDTLSKLRRMRLAAQPQPDTPHDDMPADIDEFRNELARRIRALVANRTGGGDTDSDRAAVAPAPQS